MSVQIIKGLEVIDYQALSATYSKSYPSYIHGIRIKNDGASPLTVTVNGLTWTILSTDPYMDFFFPMTHAITVTATAAYRLWVLGK